MGSSCSSAQKKNKKEKPGKSPPSPRRPSTESIPYGPPADCSSPPPPEPTPPPTQVQSPVIKDVQTKKEEVEESVFPEHVKSLLYGRIPNQEEYVLRPKEISLYVCADYLESKLEMKALYERVYPPLWEHYAQRGYELNVVNPHWGNGDCIENLSQLCLGTIANLKTRKHVVGLVLLHDSIGSARAFPSLEMKDVNDNIRQDKLFQKWYFLNNTNYILQPFWKVFSNERTPEFEAQWREETDKLLALFKENLDDDKFALHLSEDLETEIRAVVTDDQNQARNCIWAQRRFTHLPAGEKPPRDDKRLDLVKQYLQDRLPDSQKIVFYAKWHAEGLHMPEHSQYLQEFCDTVQEELTKMIDGLLEEDTTEEAQLEYNGIEDFLYNELCQLASFRFLYQSTILERTNIENSVKKYLESSSSTPLIIHGAEGSGKTSTSLKIAELCSIWYPESALVYRVVGLTPESSTQDQLLRSICEQCCALCGEHPSTAFASIHRRVETLEKLLGKVTLKRPLIILIDGLEQVISCGNRELNWLPAELPEKVYLILTLNTSSVEYESIKSLVKNDQSYLEIAATNANFCENIFQETLIRNGKILNDEALAHVTSLLQTPRATELAAYICIKYPSEIESLESVSKVNPTQILMQKLLDLTISAIGKKVVHFMFGLMINARHGLSDKEMLDLIKICDSSNPWLVDGKCPYSLWSLFIECLSPYFRSRSVENKFLMSWRCPSYRNFVSEYLGDTSTTKQILTSYFRDMPFSFNTYPNRRKLDEVRLNREELLDPEWLFHKIKGSDPYTVLEEIRLIANKKTDNDLNLLSQLLEASSYALRYDGLQWYSQVYLRLIAWRLESSDRDQTHPSMCALYKHALKPPVSSLFTLDTKLNVPTEEKCSFDQLFTMRTNPNYVISLSEKSGQIVVWNVYDMCPVRTLNGVVQPRDVKLLGESKALVLCNRELKLYDLDRGELVVRLKGVMNQKMAYYGLHDQNYVVALSRNRMYVNMLNLETGDLETTFKVGEDRFLNSLLVSVNGRICVCGDETQKPFPLLVWDLASRKLVYDLRIPHHEFITRLSAISDDGHYVVSVCRELHDSSPSFIIVYDLQSGTLFKKWKPESNSCSIAISSQGSCVINGLMNSWLLIWDLSTGVRRHTLLGHSAPVDQIRITEAGTRCATFDSTGKDRSIRVWNIVKGECEAMFTPDQPVICCQLTIDGRAIVLGLKGRANLITMILCKGKSPDEETPKGIQPYGDPEKKGQVFDVNQESLPAAPL